jgi:alginate O-acetyltransferase complex protein AlgI
MLFNSLPFIFGFFPITVVVFFALSHNSRCLAGLWLAAASLFFYGWWDPRFVPLLVGSVAFNYAAGHLINNEVRKPAPNNARLFVTFAIAVDLLVLAYFKYVGFFARIVAPMFGAHWNVGSVVLPLGISFFTFTQIAFLVDAYKRKVRDINAIQYLLFVTYFPHLIAGPILHHSQMMPQFADRRTYQIDWTNIAAGLTIFTFGLAKKVLIADALATIATPIFFGAQQELRPPLFEAWAGAMAYTLQLYFDFSGYSDMAIGLSLFFNVRLPLNFNSPYKSRNIVDFWRRWHMTLSAFLRDYLYIPLGGSRKGRARRYINLMVTMLLGGLWHGAGWTFVAWGGLHGIYLVINHAFSALRQQIGWQDGRFGRLGSCTATALTFASVVIAWVFFRAESFSTASNMLRGMFGAFGFVGEGVAFPVTGQSARNAVAVIVAGLGVASLMPNTQEFMRSVAVTTDSVAHPNGFVKRFAWNPIRWWAWTSAGLLFARCLWALSPANVSEFLYYQF